MKLGPPRTRHRRGDEELTPLINVVFLLLIFVVLAGEVVETAPFDVSPPDAIDQAATSAGTTSIYLGRSGRIFFAGKQYPPAGFAAVISALPDGHAGEMVIEADRNVDAITALALVEHLHKAGLRRIKLVTSAGGG